jgi:hypothetical protein
MTAGLIDSVMTHPDHRRRGLAKAVLSRALDFMRDSGVDVSLLYTVAGTMPYEFYGSMGYQDCLRVHVLERQEGGRGASAGSSQISDVKHARGLLDAAFRDCDGYQPMTEELWRWRRERRPDFMPVHMWTLEAGPNRVAMFAIGQAPIRTKNGNLTKSFLNDVAVIEGRADAELFRQMFDVAPSGAPIMTACAETNEPELSIFKECGFRQVSPESCMINPLTDRAQKAFRQKPSRWYAVTETIVGL